MADKTTQIYKPYWIDRFNLVAGLLREYAVRFLDVFKKSPYYHYCNEMKQKKKNNNIKENDLCIVTGANSGIGYATALGLAHKNAKIILACRNEENALKALKQIQSQTNNKNIFFIPLNLASLNSINLFVSTLEKKFPNDRVKILFNNAGLFTKERHVTENDKEMIWQVNYLSHALLTFKILPLISENGRIINVSAVGHHLASHCFPWSDPSHHICKSNFDPLQQYCNSKFAQVTFTNCLNLKFSQEKQKIRAFSLHPGVVKTRIFREANWGKCMDVVMNLFFKTPSQGAETGLYLCMKENLNLNNCHSHYSECRLVKCAMEAENLSVMRRMEDLTRRELKDFL